MTQTWISTEAAYVLGKAQITFNHMLGINWCLGFGRAGYDKEPERDSELRGTYNPL